MDALPPSHDLRLEPADDPQVGEPVVTDVTGRLWRVRTRRPNGTADLLLALIVLVLFLAVAVALLL